MRRQEPSRDCPSGFRPGRWRHDERKEGCHRQHRRAVGDERREAVPAGLQRTDPAGGIHHLRRLGRARPRGHRRRALGGHRRGVSRLSAGPDRVSGRELACSGNPDHRAAGRPRRVHRRRLLPSEHSYGRVSGPITGRRALPRRRDPRGGDRLGHVCTHRPCDGRGRPSGARTRASCDPAPDVHPGAHGLRRPDVGPYR